MVIMDDAQQIRTPQHAQNHMGKYQGSPLNVLGNQVPVPSV